MPWHPQHLNWVWDTLRSNLNVLSVVDILAVATVIYLLLTLVRGTRAVQLIKGLAVLFALIFLTEVINLPTFNWLLSRALLPGVIALIILFQPELRMALEQIGRGRWLPRTAGPLPGESASQLADQLITFTRRAAAARIGALIALERQVGLRDVIQTGQEIEMPATAEMLSMIFSPSSPLHDGAAVIRGGRVVAAGCLLPFSSLHDMASWQGTRHRAALGLSERSDAVVMVISEQTGMVSLACEGELVTNLSEEAIKHRLMGLLPSEHGRQWWRASHVASQPQN